MARNPTTAAVPEVLDGYRFGPTNNPYDKAATEQINQLAFQEFIY